MLRSVCFNGKYYVKIVFCAFQYLVILEKMSKKKLFLVNVKSMAYF